MSINVQFQLLLDAKKFTDDGKYEEALAKHIQFHNSERSDLTKGVRLSYALQYWAHLCTLYSPARIELELIRNRLIDHSMRQNPHPAIYQDIVAISDVLGQSRVSYDVFKSIAKDNHSLAVECFSFAMPSIVEYQDYNLACQFIGSAELYVSSAAKSLNKTIDDQTIHHTKSAGPSGIDHIGHKQKADLAIYVKRIKLLLNVLDGAGDVVMSDNVRQWAADKVSSNSLRSIVVNRIALNVQVN